MYSVGVGRREGGCHRQQAWGTEFHQGQLNSQPFPKSLTLETALSQDPEIRDEKL